MFRIRIRRKLQATGLPLWHGELLTMRGDREATCGIFDLDEHEWLVLADICERAGIGIDIAGEQGEARG